VQRHLTGGHGMTRATVAAPGQDALPHDQLVGLLMRARHDRSPVRMPDGFAARISPAQGYEVQRLHTQAMLARYGGCVIGTKLGGRDMAAVAALGLSGPFQGPIFSTFTHDSPAQLRRDGFFLCAVEAEIGVLIGEDIGGHPHLPERDVLVHAIQAVIPSIEIADTRYADYEQCPAAAILADLGFAGGWVRGGSGAQAMGDPLHALSLLVADLGRDGRKLCAGQVVSTGSCTTAYLAKAGESLVADFGSLGQVSVAFT
jgi:2-keto-4-pentenoate hydratase